MATARKPAARKKLTKLVNDWPILSPMQLLNGCESGNRRVRSLAVVRSSVRFSPISLLGYLLALDLQIHFSYCLGPAKGIAVRNPSYLWQRFMEDSNDN
jgi:hypothetical protein